MQELKRDSLSKREQKILMALMMCQTASDGGKSIYDLVDYSKENAPASTEAFKYAYRGGYAMKDKLIYKLITEIDHCNSGKFHYYVCEGDTTAFLVYFDYRFGGSRKQISFHCIGRCNGKLKKLLCRKMHSKGQNVHWDRKDSRANVCGLITAFAN